MSLSALADSNVSGTVKFSATSSISTNAINFAETNLPTGLSSGNPTLTYVGGTAAPGTYSGVVVTATDSDGAVLHGTFTLTVEANAVSNYGNEVNRFGNGFDSYRQHQYAGCDHRRLASDPGRPGDALPAHQRHAPGCRPARVRPQWHGDRALRVRSRRRLVL